VARARSEPYEFKTSLQHPFTTGEGAQADLRRKVEKRARGMIRPRPANDVFANATFNLTVENNFAFAIVTLIDAPRDLMSFAIGKPCDKFEEDSHSSDACETCLNGFAYNLRAARVAIASLPFTIVMTCVTVHQHRASVRDDKLTERMVQCKCPMTSPKRNRWNIRILSSRLCNGLDAGITTKVRSELAWEVRMLLRSGTNPVAILQNNTICGDGHCQARSRFHP